MTGTATGTGTGTATPRGGGPRSLGVSLLDQVLAETLDPAYRRAAEARAAGGGSGRPERRGRGRVLVALVLAVAGLLVAVTYREASAGSSGRTRVREALLGEIDAGSRTADQLGGQLAALRARVERTRDVALRASGGGQQALADLADAERGAAATAVTGPGLQVTLADAAAGADSDPVGGRSPSDSAGTVQDGDLQLVVNALWAAGAEAISVDDQRLGPTSTIRTAGEAILVDLEPVADPYVVRAVGDPAALSRAFLASPEVQALAVVAQSYGLRFQFAKARALTLPATAPADLHYASAVPPPSTPPSTAPAAPASGSASASASGSASASATGSATSSAAAPSTAQPTAGRP